MNRTFLVNPYVLKSVEADCVVESAAKATVFWFFHGVNPYSMVPAMDAEITWTLPCTSRFRSPWLVTRTASASRTGGEE